MTDQDLTDTFSSTATKIAGEEASSLVTPDWMTLLMGFLSQFLASCFGGNNPAPSPGSPASATPVQTPESIAKRLKNLSPLEQAVLHNRAKRFYVKNDMTKQHGKLAANTIITVGREQDETHLSAAVAHIQGVDASFPQVEMF